MNSSLLRSIMALFGDTNKSLADYLGLTEQTMSKKIYEKEAEFKLGEIRMIKKRYGLTPEQVAHIFFAE